MKLYRALLLPPPKVFIILLASVVVDALLLLFESFELFWKNTPPRVSIAGIDVPRKMEYIMKRKLNITQI